MYARNRCYPQTLGSLIPPVEPAWGEAEEKGECRLRLCSVDISPAKQEVLVMSNRSEFKAAIRSTYRSELRRVWSTTVCKGRYLSLLNPLPNLQRSLVDYG